MWVPTKADPSKQWTVKCAAGAHPAIRIAEGPAKIRDGKVRIFACTEGQESVAFGVYEPVAHLVAPTDKDFQAQKEIRNWRLKALKSNTEALGREYCASLINLSEVSGSGAANGVNPRSVPVEAPPERGAENPSAPLRREPKGRSSIS